MKTWSSIHCRRGLVLFMICSLSGFAWAADDPSDLRSLTSPASQDESAALGAFAPTLSADGASLLFLSPGNNVVPEDILRSFVDVFWQDLASGETRLLSASLDGSGGGNGHSGSLRCRQTAFAWSSSARPMISCRTTPIRLPTSSSTTVPRDIWPSSANIWVNRPWGPGPGRNQPLCANPIIAASGGFVAFETRATNLTVWPDDNGTVDVVLRDLLTHSNFLVSLTADGTTAASHGGQLAGLSALGNRVLFTSTATNLVAGAVHGRRQVFQRDVFTATTRWVSGQASGWFSNVVDFLDPVMSANGQVVAFKGWPDEASLPVLVLADLSSGQSILITNRVSELYPVSLDAAGQRLAWTDDVNVFVRDVPSQTLLFQTDFPPPSDDASPCALGPVLTSDGRFLAFLSSGTNLVEETTHGAFQAYLHDLDAGTTTLASRGDPGQANRGAMEAYPVLPLPDGSGVVIESLDPTLVEGDLNQASDIFLRDLDTGTTRLLSRRAVTRPASTGVGFTQWTPRALSGNGTRITFSTADSAWSVEDTNQVSNVVMVDTAQVKGQLWMPAWNEGEHVFEQTHAMLSADGLKLAYVSRQVTIGAGVIDLDVYLVDVAQVEAGEAIPKLLSDRTEVYGRSPSSTAVLMDVNSDGSQVLFGSGSVVSYFVDGFPFNSNSNLFLRPTQTEDHEASLISVTFSGNAAGNGDTSGGFFSPDDEWVVFQSLATDLVTNITTSPFIQVFARHLPSDTTRLVSHNASGAGLMEHANAPAISGDSRYVVFHSDPGWIGYRHDLLGDGMAPNEVVCTNCSDLSINSDGSLISYLTRPEPGRPAQVYVHGMASGVDTLVTAADDGAGEGDGDAVSALVSPDGRYVLVSSRASNLVPLDGNGTEDVLLRDLQAGTTILLSRSWQHGGTGNSRSLEPRFSADGRLIAFRSYANDLVPGDYNLTADVFALNLGAGDSDGDGMDDGWEMAFFDTLDRDGTEDDDQDGQSDRAEHDAGTDPTNAGSVFQVLTLDRLGGDAIVLIWTSTPGKRYQLEFKDGLDGEIWMPLGEVTYAAHGTSTALDATNAGVLRRFYRVRLVE